MNAFDTVSYMNETMNAHNFLQKRLHSVYSNCREELKGSLQKQAEKLKSRKMKDR